MGYRQRLLSLLTSAGYNIDFVGTETFGNAVMSDSDCAGFGGISDGNLANVMETGSSTHTGWVTSGPYMNSVPADVVLLHVGTNDILANDVNNNDVDRILDAIDAYESSHGTSVMVFLARIISTRYNSCNTDSRVVAFNQMMEQLAATRIANGDQLMLVDMECGAGLDYNNDLMDEVHPNQDGYDKMGQAWYNAIASWMDPPGATYTLTMESPLGNGSVTPSVGTHIYAEDTDVSVSANPATGYAFSSWTGDLESTENPAQLTMNGNKSVKANFNKLSYQLTLDTDGTAGASINPWGNINVNHGEATGIEVWNVPEGYSFDGWELISGSSVSIADPAALSTTVILESGDASVRANFIPLTYSLSVAVQGEGSVVIDPAQESYSHNSTVNLTAVAESGFTFTGWSGDLGGNENPASLNMDGNKNLTASFSQDPYTLTVLSDGTEGVEIIPDGSIFVEQDVSTTVEVKTIPIDYVFDAWELVSGSMVRIGNTFEPITTVSLGGGNATIRANFQRKVQVLGVDIPNESHIIGDTVWAEIFVKDDKGNHFELVSGTIGAYDLDSLKRIDSSLYKARFAVFEGGSDFLADEDIPVSGLVLGDGEAESLSFDQMIMQDQDPIDANAPQLISMTVPSSIYLVDDTIVMIIMADGEGYQALSGSMMNGVDLESDRIYFSEIGEGEYQLSYVVAEEDLEVASGELVASVHLRDAPGNTGFPYTELQDNTLVIKIGTAIGVEGSDKGPHFFPNPADEYIVFLPGEGLESDSRIEVVDMAGQVAMVQQLAEGVIEFKLEISELEAGNYLLRLVNREGTLWTGLLIKTD